MALSYPLSTANFWDFFYARLSPKSRFWLEYNQEVSGLGSGVILSKDLSPSLWRMRVESVPLTFDDADYIQATLEALQGAMRTFYAYNPFRIAPKYDSTGSNFNNVRGGSSKSPVTLEYNSSTGQVRFLNLWADYYLVRGDTFGFQFGTSRALHRLLEGYGNPPPSGSSHTSTAIASTGWMDVQPAIRQGVSNGLQVTVAKPIAEFKLVPGRVDIQDALDPFRRVISFEAVQWV